MPAAPQPEAVSGGLRLAEIVSALSYALDLTDGQPPGHSVRATWIGMHIGQALGMSEAELSDLYYTLLLKDLGCSSNAARICELFVTSDHEFKRHAALIDDSLGQVLRFVVANTSVKSGLVGRLKGATQPARPALAPILIHKPGPLFDESPARQAALAGVYRRGLEEVGALLTGVRTRPG